ncbi:MAG: DUF1553 domain-containing protein [Acidobacteriia bacterium]|nr:DUF1553 domain-containing protein [Terriglobia bacterium]
MSHRKAAAALFVFALCAFAWVDQAKDDAWVASRRNWWAFQAPQRARVPQGASSPIDAFLLEALREKGLKPSPGLDRTRLIRRLSLDLTGLPPLPGEVNRFLRDTAPNAYEQLVDRLMASPHYGERLGQKWLDVVRYADTNGYELDEERPHAWRYRDYVVASFNNDKPYDRFLREQIAGDELYPGDQQALIATGFHRAGPIHLVGGNQDEEMNRQEVLTEMTGAIGSAYLGLTIGCARCHNHKFDPIPQADYYRLQAILAATQGKDIVIATEAEKINQEHAVKAFEARLKPVADQIREIEKPYRERIRAGRTAKLEPRYLAVLEVPKDKRTEEEKKLAKEAEAQIKVSWDDVLAVLTPEDRDRRTALRRQMHQLEYDRPPGPAKAYAVANMEKPPATHILKVGNHKMKLDEVGPGMLRVLNPPEAPITAAGRRSALANWLTSPGHPLTARVMVNRIWQLRMGTGIVATPNDFGLLGSRPTNLKLLDWLATELVASGWSIKKLDRLILMSAAYRQDTAYGEANAKIDPDNKLYWRGNRRRLEAELLRDSVLAVSGALNPRLGGPPVKVPIEPEVYDLIFTEGEPDNLWPVNRDQREHFRRSLYLLNKRTVRLPYLANFDQPDNMTSCPVRPTSTHSLQALSLMNSPFMQQQSEMMAERIKSGCGKDGADCQIRRAYSLALSRAPKPAELTMARKFLGEGPLADFCLAMLNRNEFVYVP